MVKYQQELQALFIENKNFDTILGILCVPHRLHLMAKGIGKIPAIVRALEIFREVLKDYRNHGPLAAILKQVSNKSTVGLTLPCDTRFTSI